MTSVINHGQACNAECPVIYDGAEAEYYDYRAMYSKQVYETSDGPEYFRTLSSSMDYPYTQDECEEEIEVPEKFSHIFFKRPSAQDREFAGMANPTDRHYDLEREAGLLTVDNGATTTLSRTLFNMKRMSRDVRPRLISLGKECRSRPHIVEERHTTSEMQLDRYINVPQEHFLCRI